MNGIIISATSDIATAMCLRWRKKGWNLCGTFCSKGENYALLQEHTIPLIHCDLSQKSTLAQVSANIIAEIPSWDFVLFATGSQEPVGPFAKVDIETWLNSLHVNFLHQIYLLHQLLPFKKPAPLEKSALFFAGGGTNNAVVNYSAYTVSKIALMKFCELLDSEIEDVKFSIIGPGWVKTKIHEATLRAGSEMAGNNFEKTQFKLNSDECVPMDRVIDSFEWILNQPKKVVGGRNFSTQFDLWGTEELAALLSRDSHMYKLRRSGNNVLVQGKSHARDQ